MYSKFLKGIVWVQMVRWEGQLEEPWKVPMKAKVYGEWSVWQEDKKANWSVTHNPSGLMAAKYTSKKEAELRAIQFQDNMQSHWSGNLKDEHEFFINELGRLKRQLMS